MEQAGLGGIGRLVPRLATVAFDGIEQRSLLSADVSARAAPQLQVKAKAATEDVMSNSNRLTLAQLGKMTAEEVQAIPQDQFVMLVEEAAEQLAKYKAYDGTLKAETARRYAEKAANARKAANKDTGTVSIIDGDFKVKADLPKKVKWDQAKMAAAVAEISTWEDTIISEYVDIEYSVPEKRYLAWPTPIRKIFEPARTVETGTQTFKFEREAA